MKKFLSLITVLTCCGCATVPTKQQIQQNLTDEGAMQTQLLALRDSGAHKQIQEYVKTLNEIDKHKSLTKADYDKIVSIYGYPDTDRLATTYDDCWATREKKDSNKLAQQMQTITNSAKTFANDNCGKYLSYWQNTNEQKTVLSDCHNFIKQYFFSGLFNDTEINADSINSKINEYKNKQWEKETGCDHSKIEYLWASCYEIFQQTKDGTLLAVTPSCYYPGVKETVFITKHKQLSSGAEGITIMSNLPIQNIGTYKYTTITGKIKTVEKYKLCNGKEGIRGVRI